MGTSVPLPQIADRFKRALITDTAMRLNQAHGRRKMYSALEVAQAVEKAQFPAGWTGWPMAVFCTGPEFQAYCVQAGISADYAATRETALRFIDKPTPRALPAGTGLGVGALAAGAALTAGMAAAAASDGATPDRGVLRELADMAETALDVVDVAGEIFEFLSIFD